MADLFNLLIKAGPVVLLMGLVLSIVLALFGCIRHGDGRAAWLVNYVLVSFGVGVAGLFIGAALGMVVFCSMPSMGNLCGLGGVFGSGPMLAGIALAAYAHRRVLAADNQARDE